MMNLFLIFALLQSLVVIPTLAGSPGDPPPTCDGGDKYPPVKYESGPAFTQEQLKAAREAGLERHNHFRKLHGAPLMTLNDTLNERAQQAAECCVKWGKMFHTSSGENLANVVDSVSSNNASKLVLDSVNMWYEEYCEGTTDPKDSDDGVVKGHFTQVVWKTSVQLGIGVAVKSTTEPGDWRYGFVVGRYSPPGNWIGQTDAEVGPLIGMSDEGMCCRTKIPKDGKFRAKAKKGDECVKGGVKLGATAGGRKAKSGAQMVVVVAVAIGLFPFLMG